MPLVCYCAKCKTETPLSQTCMHCEGKVSQSSQHISYGYTHWPYRDFFAYNECLRIVLCALGVVMLVAMTAQGISAGAAGIFSLFENGFARVLLILLLSSVLLLFFALLFRGKQSVHCVLNKEGIRVDTYLSSPNAFRIWMHFTTGTQVEKLASLAPTLPSLTLVRRDFVPWSAMRCLRIWRRGSQLFVYRPRFWMATWALFPMEEYAQIHEYIQTKSKRNKQCKLLIMY